MTTSTLPVAPLVASWIRPEGGIWLPSYLDEVERSEPLDARRRFYAVTCLADLLTPAACAHLFDRRVDAPGRPIRKVLRDRNWKTGDYTEGLINLRSDDDTLIITADDDGHPNLIYSLGASASEEHVEECMDLAINDYGSTCAIGFTWDEGWLRDTGNDMG